MLVENVIPVASCVPLGTRPQPNISCLTARRLRLPILFSTNIKSLRARRARRVGCKKCENIFLKMRS